MTWLASIGTALLMFVGGLFGFHQPPASAPVPNAPQETQQAPQTQVDGMQQAGNQTGNAPSGEVVTLMGEIGCSDVGSCESACMKTGMTPACQQLLNLMTSSMRQYSAGSPNGQGMNHTVAYVGNNTAANAGSLPDCPASNALFDTSPLSLSNLSGIEALGHMNAEHILPNQADHLYLDARSPSATEVYAPGAATLLAVAKSVGTNGEDAGTGTVRLFFSPCKSVMFALQISALSPALEAALANTKPSNVQAGATITSTMYGNLNIPLKSGEALGTIVGLSGRGGEVDFAAADVRTTPWQFIDQNEQTGMLADSYAHAVCPLDYFGGSLRTNLYSLITMKHQGENGIPACGAVMQDKAGTAEGNWYDKAASKGAYQGINESGLLAIVHSNLDAAEGIVSVGTALIETPALGTQILFTPAHTGFVNREPSEITPDGHVYCFSGPAGGGGNGAVEHVDIRLESATTLTADYATGACAATPTLSSNTVTYER
ncbi:MAG: hypothetical protein KGI73_00220 [Patescibacteria group bacterium]|nr:hypothetical protein [Patescibacteria group bacterium]